MARPLTDAEGHLFDNGIDWIADPTQLSGAWRAEWEEGVQARVAAADRILLVEVSALRTDMDPERRRTYRLQVDVREALLGPSPDETILLAVRQDDPGFGTLRGREQQVLSKPFVAFLRRVPSGSGGASWRWHLIAAGKPALAQVRRWVGLRTRRPGPEEPTRRRVIVH